MATRASGLLKRVNWGDGAGTSKDCGVERISTVPEELFVVATAVAELGPPRQRMRLKPPTISERPCRSTLARFLIRRSRSLNGGWRLVYASLRALPFSRRRVATMVARATGS